eukprot:TRINITY_DN29925_c0_g1_i3.p1 TRINITY_DN29925_c0_g1~~TRINITY_DN29925_c0_g1_i3.p1  ORF type:complete len:106 (-),score=13.00 TRINITY_DN29925_c0_g1_i3:256-573(-)
MSKLASQPNVFVKLSGLPQTFAHCGWTAQDFEPYIRQVVEVFGAERVNFAGNWFVLNEVKWCGEYGRMFDTVLESLSRINTSAADLDMIFWGTAQRLYNISLRHL